jgi:hypothetical protein
MAHARCIAGAVLASGVALAAASPALADEQSIIKNPGDHPSYFFEAEPHVLFGFGGPFENRGDVGIGFRGSFNIHDGPISSINDSFGVGVGIDIAPFSGGDWVLVPVVFQWNFWLSTHWSVFGEPGLAFCGGGRCTAVPILYAGGRFHITPRIALTLRIGYPDFSFGVSFLL